MSGSLDEQLGIGSFFSAHRQHSIEKFGSAVEKALGQGLPLHQAEQVAEHEASCPSCGSYPDCKCE